MGSIQHPEIQLSISHAHLVSLFTIVVDHMLFGTRVIHGKPGRVLSSSSEVPELPSYDLALKELNLKAIFSLEMWLKEHLRCQAWMLNVDSLLVGTCSLLIHWLIH